jgi:hypothetical protein
MGADRPELAANQEISWRLKELGPELRRALFEQALHPNGSAPEARQGKDKRRPANAKAEPAAARPRENRR